MLMAGDNKQTPEFGALEKINQRATQTETALPGTPRHGSDLASSRGPTSRHDKQSIDPV
jgi:hypothetical protein